MLHLAQKWSKMPLRSTWRPTFELFGLYQCKTGDRNTTWSILDSTQIRRKGVEGSETPLPMLHLAQKWPKMPLRSTWRPKFELFGLYQRRTGDRKTAWSILDSTQIRIKGVEGSETPLPMLSSKVKSGQKCL
jgi:hypothetical protein